ncbi:MAG: type II toxin-antitoxin system VapC family toxin [Methylibium sp.]|uniref:type II toxin-antitoxin system VapC family toxin n=1 Tax=Methylibium sp. TaxID=2067992 RepID=UPI0017911A13|nr:type II toxin-antitoxin system VapC family toxin [Methylibium sp.]MBA3595800.1 type II toxin-antitoxin system VapC family toxin [Methylibium sp.]
MSSFVLDTSAALSWCFADEHESFSERLLDQATQSGVLVPMLWHTEMAAALLAAQRHGLLESTELRLLGALFDRLQIQTDAAAPERARHDVLLLAQETGLSVQDATYLDLAMRRQLPLATFDPSLQRAAAALRIPTLAP